MHYLMMLTTRLLHKLLSRPEPTVTYSYKLHGQVLLRKAIHASKVYNTKRIQSVEQLCYLYLERNCSKFQEELDVDSDGSSIEQLVAVQHGLEDSAQDKQVFAKFQPVHLLDKNGETEFVFAYVKEAHVNPRGDSFSYDVVFEKEGEPSQDSGHPANWHEMEEVPGHRLANFEFEGAESLETARNDVTMQIFKWEKVIIEK